MATHQDASEHISGDDMDKQAAEYLDEVEDANAVNKPNRALEAPELIRNLTPEERVRLEKKLTRKIDFRLLPAVIIMYILNYLDRVSRLALARVLICGRAIACEYLSDFTAEQHRHSSSFWNTWYGGRPGPNRLSI